MSVKVPGMNQAKRLFERDFRDVIALVEGGPSEVYKKFGAELAAHAELGETIDKYVMVHLATPASVNERMFSEMVDEIYRVFCVLFVRLRDRNAFRFVAGQNVTRSRRTIPKDGGGGRRPAATSGIVRLPSQSEACG